VVQIVEDRSAGREADVDALVDHLGCALKSEALEEYCHEEFHVARHYSWGLFSARFVWCAVKRCRSSAGAIPARQLSLQPVAIEAAVAATKSPKPSMERTSSGSASRQAVT
jgi:hypothetical protein